MASKYSLGRPSPGSQIAKIGSAAYMSGIDDYEDTPIDVSYESYFPNFKSETDEVVKKYKITDMPSTAPPVKPKQPLSIRNNNPGNLRLRDQEGAVMGENNMAKFPSAAAGMEALRKQIILDTQTRGMNLGSFINKYAPPFENDTNNYINFVKKSLGISSSDKVSPNLIDKLQRAIIQMEGGQDAISYYYGKGKK